VKVLHVYRTYYPETQGGLQEAIRQICRATSAKGGVQNTVFTLAKQPHPRSLRADEGLIVRSKSVMEIASCDIGSVAAIWRFRSLAARADLLHFHYPWPFGDVLGLLASRAKPFVITYHSDVVRQRALDMLYAPVRKLFFKRAARVVTTSPAYHRGSDFLSAISTPVSTIPLCLDESFAPQVDADRVAHWRNEFPNGFFLFVGVLRYYKGLDFLVEAAARTGFPVVIAGSGPEEVRLRKAATLCPNVYFVGHVSDVEKYALLHACRAVVFPSHLRSEAFGVTLLEGAICRKPLISTEIGTGTSYVNEDGLTGIVVPPADVDRLAIAMRNLADDPARAASMGEACYQRYHQLFSAQSVGGQYVRLYREVLDNAEIQP
jgi:rhamnosyl/mannosyltransferase